MVLRRARHDVEGLGDGSADWPVLVWAEAPIINDISLEVCGISGEVAKRTAVEPVHYDGAPSLFHGSGRRRFATRVR